MSAYDALCTGFTAGIFWQLAVFAFFRSFEMGGAR